MSTIESNLPRVKSDDLKVWDEELGICGGYLEKKAGKQSVFTKGKWQKRWFFINIALKPTENYTLEYLHFPEDRNPSKKYNLAENASVIIGAGNSFQLTINNDPPLIIQAESTDIRDDWVSMLNSMILVAVRRARLIKERAQSLSDADGSDAGEAHELNDDHTRNSKGDKIVNPFQVRHKVNPQLRLDVDINSIPPSSTQRRQFEEMIIEDIASALLLKNENVEILSLKPALGMDWLTVVEFDIVLFKDKQYDEDGDEIADLDEDKVEEALIEQRKQLLRDLNALVVDASSRLYRGFITSKLDPSFTAGLIDKDLNDNNLDLYSADPTVLAVLNKYKDVVLPYDYIDTSHFKIILQFEGRMIPLDVPNPLVFPRRRHCAIWPFEIKKALGLWGTLQELWIEPVSLVPVGMPKSMSQPIDFEPSARLGGAVGINAYRLKAELVYEVICDDFRTAVKESLTEEEYEQIEATFNEYDLDGNGYISKSELEAMVRARVQERKDIIEEKFQAVVKTGLTPEELQQAEESKHQHLQQLNESQLKLVKMFEAADINQDGTLSKDEFILAEAWWMHCTLNPQHAHLF